jgi:hypothetical protein
MNRKWLRPVALLSLAAYLFANTPTEAVLAAHLAAARPHSHPSQPVPKAPGQARHRCKHCSRHRHLDPKKETSRPAPEPKSDSRGPSCPCCPEEPSKPFCPCPGGCAYCSVAKVPCLTPFTLAAEAAVCALGPALEEAFLYAAPCWGGLFRPPRS